MYYTSLNSNNLLALSTERSGGVSTGAYASMNMCHYVDDSPENVAQNRALFCQKYGIKKLVFPRQTHSANVRVIDTDFLRADEAEQSRLLNEIDALVTNVPEVCLGINTADCVPVLLYDTVHRAIGLAHAGWRGTVARIAAKTAEQMHQLYCADYTDLRVALGPSISAANYPVGDELLRLFAEAKFDVDTLFQRDVRDQKLHLDLWQANVQQLVALGVPEQQIEVTGICSFANSDSYFSARRLGVHSGRIATCLMLK